MKNLSKVTICLAFGIIFAIFGFSQTKKITYKVSRSNWFVISGYENENIFYEKTIFRNDEFMTFEIEYPKDQKSIFNPIAAKISKSFK